MTKTEAVRRILFKSPELEYWYRANHDITQATITPEACHIYGPPNHIGEITDRILADGRDRRIIPFYEPTEKEAIQYDESASDNPPW